MQPAPAQRPGLCTCPALKESYFVEDQGNLAILHQTDSQWADGLHWSLGRRPWLRVYLQLDCLGNFDRSWRLRLFISSLYHGHSERLLAWACHKQDKWQMCVAAFKTFLHSYTVYTGLRSSPWKVGISRFRKAMPATQLAPQHTVSWMTQHCHRPLLNWNTRTGQSGMTEGQMTMWMESIHNVSLFSSWGTRWLLMATLYIVSMFMAN